MTVMTLMTVMAVTTVMTGTERSTLHCRNGASTLHLCVSKWPNVRFRPPPWSGPRLHKTKYMTLGPKFYNFSVFS